MNKEGTDQIKPKCVISAALQLWLGCAKPMLMKHSEHNTRPSLVHVKNILHSVYVHLLTVYDITLFAIRVPFLADHLISSITSDLLMNIHAAHSAEQLAMTSDYINGRSMRAGDEKSSGPIFPRGQICGLSRCVEYRDSWITSAIGGLAFSEISGDK